MAVKQDFLNPKSMLTPGIAGGIVMMISNTLLVQFALPARWTALALSALLGVVVFVATAIPLWQRIIYYIFNSLIIFCIAVGSNRVAGVSSSLSAHLPVSLFYASVAKLDPLRFERLSAELLTVDDTLYKERREVVQLVRACRVAPDDAAKRRLNGEIVEAYLRIKALESQREISQSAIEPRKWFDDWF